MGFIIGTIVFCGACFALFKLYVYNKTMINFYIEGLNGGFGFSDLNALWKCALMNTLEEPNALFVSASSLTKCITQIKAQAELGGNSRLQSLLTRLYAFRSKIEKEADKTRTIDSTMALTNGQVLRIIYPGFGIFDSTVVANGAQLTIPLPTQDGKYTVESKDWIGKQISVYFWRMGDAQYVFDTNVVGAGIFIGKPALYLEHSTSLTRTQKRNAVRAECHIEAQMYILQEEPTDYKKVETQKGLQCVLLDISETGAFVKIGGKGVVGLKLRLQFQVFDKLVVMFGVVRSVQYDELQNVSKLHFQCTHIEDEMRNQVLSYVYNILPEAEKEVMRALQKIAEDEKRDVSIKDNTTAQDATKTPQASETGEAAFNEVDEEIEREIEEKAKTEKKGAEDLSVEEIVHKLDDENALPDLEEL